MKRIWRYYLFAAIFVLVVYIRPFLRDKYHSRSLLVSEDSSSRLGLDWNRPPKITIITVWSILGPSPNYLRYFFKSVEANDQVDLLFVQLDRKGLGCSSYSDAANIQELCLSEDQYYRLHVDFLCRRWKCSDEEKQMVYEIIKTNGESDPGNTHFRILRAGIFAHLIDPATTLWGWCDVDEYWGNFTRSFPWDVAHDFDVLAPTGQPDFASHRMIYTRGHMAFIRNSPEILDKLHSFPKFSTLQAYLSLSPTLTDAEESEFSHYIFSEEPSFTFLTFEGILNSYDAALISTGGVFYAPIQKEDLQDPDRRRRLARLAQPQNKALIRPTFSDQGVEVVARVYNDGQHFPYDVWFDRKHVTYVEAGWTKPEEREQKAYFLRRESHGPVTQRLEPRERYLTREGELVVDECLYKHWQVEKHRPWFRRIPDVLASDRIFVQHGHMEAEVWSEHGDIVYSTGR